MLKKGIRILALDDASFTRDQAETMVVGLVGRDAGIEGVLSFNVNVDGDDATEKLISRVRGSRFSNQIKLIAMNGVSFGGMNIVDLVKVRKELSIPIIAITRTRPRRTLLIGALKKIQPSSVKKKAKIINGMKGHSDTIRTKGFYVQCFGVDKGSVERVFPKSIELLRLCHLLASGVTKGESKGRI